MQKKKLSQKLHVWNVERYFEITQILRPSVFMKFLFLQSGGYGWKLKTGCDPV